MSETTVPSTTAGEQPTPNALRLGQRENRIVRAVTHGPAVMQAEHLDVWFGSHQVLEGIDMQFPERSVTALIGPSGCGKSTFLRCLNRMHELVPGARVRGSVRLRDRELYSADANPIAIRRAIGMVFQRPNPFPTKSIADNILSGPKFNRVKMSRGERAELVEKSLQSAGLWNEVKDRLDAPAGGLSGGQQQRLCIARALAIQPNILLMDEPASALDPIATQRIEELVYQLKSRYTIVIVTHNMQQAARVSDRTAFFWLGKLVEYAPTERIFTNPTEKLTEDYVTGRFG